MTCEAVAHTGHAEGPRRGHAGLRLPFHASPPPPPVSLLPGLSPLDFFRTVWQTPAPLHAPAVPPRGSLEPACSAHDAPGAAPLRALPCRFCRCRLQFWWSVSLADYPFSDLLSQTTSQGILRFLKCLLFQKLHFCSTIMWLQKGSFLKWSDWKISS